MRRFLAKTLVPAGDSLTLDSGVSHHMLRVTGIAPGEIVELFDGNGRSCRAELVSVESGDAVLRVLEYVDSPVSSRHVRLVLSQLRASTMDGVLRMATELGVSEIQVVQAARCVAQGDKRDRWTRVVTAAAGQCGRADVPVLPAPVSVGHVLSQVQGTRLICVPGAAVVAAPEGDVTLLVGPEGGFTDDEVSQATALGWLAVGLGGSVLRADTAAVAGLVRYGG
ncbi:MAG: RsmE family RNA methyltransferase [Myxococcota bacterium]